jgi:hypothetical protein
MTQLSREHQADWELHDTSEYLSNFSVFQNDLDYRVLSGVL